MLLKIVILLHRCFFDEFEFLFCVWLCMAYTYMLMTAICFLGGLGLAYFGEDRLATLPQYQSRIKGQGGPGQFYWWASMMYFMTSSFVKVMFSLIRKVPVCFFR